MTSGNNIGQDVETELRSCPDIDDTDIAVKVNGSAVTLSGFVNSYMSKYHAEIETRRINGVTAVANDIVVRPLIAAPTDPEIVKHRIEETFRRLAQVDAEHIIVDTAGSEVVLRGEVSSSSERDQAQRSAWSTPGVTNVKNELTVRS